MLEKPLLENRWGTRIALDVPAQVSARDGRSAAATVRNASVSGAFIDSALRLAVFTRISVRPLSRSGPGLDAYVVRTEGYGFAVEWFHPGARPVSTMLPLRDGSNLQPGGNHPHRQVASCNI